MKSHDAVEHDTILLDEISPGVAIKIKKAMQASNELVTMGASPTMCSSYTVHLHRCQIICCSNVWAAGLKRCKKEDRAWLEANSCFVAVKSSLWQCEDSRG